MKKRKKKRSLDFTCHLGQEGAAAIDRVRDSKNGDRDICVASRLFHFFFSAGSIRHGCSVSLAANCSGGIEQRKSLRQPFMCLDDCVGNINMRNVSCSFWSIPPWSIF